MWQRPGRGSFAGKVTALSVRQKEGVLINLFPRAVPQTNQQDLLDTQSTHCCCLLSRRLTSILTADKESLLQPFLL